MRIIKLKKNHFHPFLETISRKAQLWAPVKKGTTYAFDRVEDFNRIEMKATRTYIPPKKLMVPPNFNMFTFTAEGYREDLSHISPKILFGIHPCDIHGLLILDKLFTHAVLRPLLPQGPEEDPDPRAFLLAGRTLLLQIHPDTTSSRKAIDLFFTDLESYFLVWIGSSQGDDLVRTGPGPVRRETDRQRHPDLHSLAEGKGQGLQDGSQFVSMPDLMELKYKAAFWEEVAPPAWPAAPAPWFARPATVTTLPTSCSWAGSRASRHPLLGFLHAAGIFRGGRRARTSGSTKSDRLSLWYTHKLQAYVSKYGKPSCVGCGRCLVTCPVEINVKTVARSLEGEDRRCLLEKNELKR